VEIVMGKRNKVKIQRHLGRDEAVQQLQALVQELSAGTLTISGHSVTVPDPVYLEIEAEEDEVEIKLKWRPSVYGATRVGTMDATR
jgi:amphi-Trp domain-containing protein